MSTMPSAAMMPLTANAVLIEALTRTNPITIGAKNLPKFLDIATTPLNVPRK